MDDTDTNQAESTSSSPEDLLRQFDYLSDLSPAFFPGLVRVRRTPPVSPEEEEETKRESPRSETTTPVRQLRFATPIPEDPPSPLPPFEEPEPPTMSGPPTVEELDDRQHDTPADPNVKLHKDKDGLPRTDEWHYWSLIGQLNYLSQSTRP